MYVCFVYMLYIKNVIIKYILIDMINLIDKAGIFIKFFTA